MNDKHKVSSDMVYLDEYIILFELVIHQSMSPSNIFLK